MKKPVTTKAPAEQVVKDIRPATRKLHSSEEKIRIVLSGLRGEDGIAELCRKEGIAQSLYYSWSKEFLEAGKKRLAGDTARQANTGEVKDLRAEALALKELVADLSLENRLLKKHDRGWGRAGHDGVLSGQWVRIQPRQVAGLGVHPPHKGGAKPQGVYRGFGSTPPDRCQA